MSKYDSFPLYAMDQMGAFDTRPERIQKAVRVLLASDDPNDSYTQKRIFSEYNLDPLSYEEIVAIEEYMMEVLNNEE